MKKEIIIGNDLSEIPLVIGFVQEIGTSYQLPADMMMRICLALEEAIANVIQHAYPGGENHEIWLKINVSSQEMVFTLTDNGIPFDYVQEEGIDKTLSLEQYITNGMGTRLIHQIMDGVSYQRLKDYNQMIMQKKINVEMVAKKNLSTNICKVEGITILTVQGRLDTVNAQEFEEEVKPLMGLPNPNIIINCEDFAYICSSGIRILIMLQKCVTKNGGQLIFEAMRPEILKIFQMTGCTSFFTIR